MKIDQDNLTTVYRYKNVATLLFAMMLIVIAAYAMFANSANADEPKAYDQAVRLQPEGSTANCRYGVSPLSDAQNAWVSTLGAGFYINFLNSTNVDPANGADFYHLIRVSQDKDTSGNYLNTYTTNPPINGSTFNNLIDNNPGHVWIVGNEADRGPNPNELVGGQDDTFPDMYATIYHDVYHYIKERDPSARVMNSALVQVTPGRIQYLDLMWDAYLEQYGVPMPVDIWNMHIYILPEVTPTGAPNGVANVALGTSLSLGKKESGGNASNCASVDVYCFAEHDNISIFVEQVRAMRIWMKEHGQQNKPLVLSEYSILYPYEIDADGCFLQDEFGNCFTPERVNNFMINTFQYMESTTDPSLGYPLDNNRLVQQWLWFAVQNDGVGSASNLINDEETALTLVGQTFQNQTAAQGQTRNLLVDMVQNSTVDSGGTGLANVPVGTTIRNNGNHKVEPPFTVTFRDSANAIIDQVVVNEAIAGCTVDTFDVSAIWTDVPSGAHEYTVSIDSANSVSETDEGDNVGTGVVIVDPVQIMLPKVTR